MEDTNPGQEVGLCRPSGLTLLGREGRDAALGGEGRGREVMWRGATGPSSGVRG